MKCKIKWTETKCELASRYDSFPTCKRKNGCCGAREVQHGYEGDIQEYTIETSASGQSQCITIIVNNRRKIKLLVNRYGADDEDFYCPFNYQDVTTFEIDGKPVKGYEGEDQPNDQE